MVEVSQTWEHSIALGFHREFYGGMCFVRRVQEVRCCFYTGQDGDRIVNISSIATLRRSTRSVLVMFKSYVVLSKKNVKCMFIVVMHLATPS